ncbi:hypothetical protein NQ317_015342 [Molorchus minor]|uniref:Uncharacterized protein n=1 Tax=Molorchus minor TaxID=1323400 RepID=A0ABQ9J2W5_9CUCU|nr:hypothetical protein NQ317_015342 [Molorchus minor]
MADLKSLRYKREQIDLLLLDQEPTVEVDPERYEQSILSQSSIEKVWHTHATKIVKPKDISKNFISTEKTSCLFCKQSHVIINCPDILRLSAQTRLAEAKKFHLCLNSLHKNQNQNFVKDCKSVSCKKCGRRHHTLLHFGGTREDVSHDTSVHNRAPIELGICEAENSNSMHIVDNRSPTQVLLVTAIVLVKDIAVLKMAIYIAETCLRLSKF